MSKTKLILSYIAGWALAIGFFWISGDADAMGYSILFIWIIQPVLILYGALISLAGMGIGSAVRGKK